MELSPTEHAVNSTMCIVASDCQVFFLNGMKLGHDSLALAFKTPLGWDYQRVRKLEMHHEDVVYGFDHRETRIEIHKAHHINAEASGGHREQGYGCAIVGHLETRYQKSGEEDQRTTEQQETSVCCGAAHQASSIVLQLGVPHPQVPPSPLTSGLHILDRCLILRPALHFLRASVRAVYDRWSGIRGWRPWRPNFHRWY